MSKKRLPVFSIIVLLVLFSSFCFFEGAVFSPKFTTFNFGTVEQGVMVNGKFPFQNTGNKPLLIEYVQVSDGGIVATGPKEMVPPRKWDTIFFHFNSAGRSGAFDKIISVKQSDVEQVIALHVKGYVKAKTTKQ